MRQRVMINLVLLTTIVLAAPASAGLYFEQSITSEGAGDGMEMSVRGWAEGEKAKIEYTESNNEIMPPGSYLLTTDGGQTVYLVDPEEQTYSEWDIAKVFAMLGQMEEMSGGMMKIDFKDPVSETLATESGGPLLGYPTTHYTWRSGFTLEMKMAFMNQSNRSVTTTDAWVTQAVHHPGLYAWLQATPPTTGDEELDQHLRSEMSRFDDGLVLKMDQETVTTNKKGKQTTSTTHYEVTTLREESVDASTFAMPTGYTETPLVPSMGEGAQAQEGQQAAEEEQGPVKRLKGLFGGKEDD